MPTIVNHFCVPLVVWVRGDSGSFSPKLGEKHLGNIEEISSERIKALCEEKEGYQSNLATKKLEVEELQEKIATLIRSEADHDKLASLKIMLESRKTNTEKKIKFFDFQVWNRLLFGT